MYSCSLQNCQHLEMSQLYKLAESKVRCELLSKNRVLIYKLDNLDASLR